MGAPFFRYLNERGLSDSGKLSRDEFMFRQSSLQIHPSQLHDFIEGTTILVPSTDLLLTEDGSINPYYDQKRFERLLDESVIHLNSDDYDSARHKIDRAIYHAKTYGVPTSLGRAVNHVKNYSILYWNDLDKNVLQDLFSRGFYDTAARLQRVILFHTGPRNISLEPNENLIRQTSNELVYSLNQATYFYNPARFLERNSVKKSPDV